MSLSRATAPQRKGCKPVISPLSPPPRSKNNPRSIPSLALQGQVPGLDIEQQSGYATAPVKVELRGRSALGQFPSDPLYIVDGVPLTVVEIGGLSGYPTSAGFIQNNGQLAPTTGQKSHGQPQLRRYRKHYCPEGRRRHAIYGSRGANGVILVTTKKVKPVKPGWTSEQNRENPLSPGSGICSTPTNTWPSGGRRSKTTE